MQMNIGTTFVRGNIQIIMRRHVSSYHVYVVPSIVNDSKLALVIGIVNH